jgi:hypothetical protein
MLGAIGGNDQFTISAANLPANALNINGEVIVGEYFSGWGSNAAFSWGNASSAHALRSSLDSSNGWQTELWTTRLDVILTDTWRSVPIDNRPSYMAVNFIVKI